jgi:hypothetical protein
MVRLTAGVAPLCPPIESFCGFAAGLAASVAGVAVLCQLGESFRRFAADFAAGVVATMAAIAAATAAMPWRAL